MPRPHHTAPHGTTPSHALPRPPSPSLALPGGVVISNVIDPTLLSVMSIDDEIVALNDQELSAYGITGHESLAQALKKEPLRARPLKLTCKRAAVKPSGGRQAKPGTTADELPPTAVCIGKVLKKVDPSITDDELKAVPPRQALATSAAEAAEEAAEAATAEPTPPPPQEKNKSIYMPIDLRKSIGESTSGSP